MKKLEPIQFVDFKSQTRLITPKLVNNFKKVLASGWYILGTEVANFEEEFASYLESKHCIGVGNGLEALQISLMALDIGKNDEVITTPVSAVATTLAILAVGAKPIFVDTDSHGLMDADLIESAITKHTKAILPVHLYGQAVNLDKILAIVKKHKLSVIEDACQAHGSAYRARRLGTFGKFGCFSFYPTKNLGAYGDGGAIVTSDDKLAKICRQIRDYGQRDKYTHVRFGLNSRLDELQATLLMVKLTNLDSENSQRQKLAKRYIQNLKGVQIVLPEDIDECNFHQFVIRVKNRNHLQKALKQANIPTLIHYPKIIPDQPFLKGQFPNLDLPEARKFVKETLSLPIHPLLNMKQIDFISAEILKLL